MIPRLRAALAWSAPVLRLIPGTALALSGYLKAVRPAAEFAATLESYWLFPPAVIPFLSVAVPWVEILAGLALATGYMLPAAAGAGAALFAGFIAALAQVIVRKIPMDSCGCFGDLGPKLTPLQSASLDGVLLLLCLLVLLDRERRWSLDRWLSR